MTIQIPYRWALYQGCSKTQAYRVARIMAINRGSFTDAMIAAGYWNGYKQWV